MANDDETPTGVFSLLVTGFGLSRKQTALALRIAWVVAVTSTLWYILFGFAILNLAAPFARAEDVKQDVKELHADVASLKQNTAISARAGLAAEIRAQVAAWCSVRGNVPAQEAIRRTIDSRQDEYAALNSGNRYPETGCPP